MDNLNTYILSSFKKHKERPFLKIKKEFFYKEYSYVESLKFTKQLISFLRSKGVEKGDRVVVWGQNMPEWSVTFLACLLEGIVIVPASILASVELTEKLVKETEPKLIIKSIYMPNLNTLGAEIVELEYIFDYVRDLDIAQVRRDLSDNDLAEILYTSGTTGLPKGTMLTRGNFAAQVKGVLEVVHIKDHPRTLSLLPYSHIFEQVAGFLIPLNFGVKVHFVGHLTPKVIQDAFVDYKITHMALVPEILQTFWDKADYTLKQKHIKGIFNGLQALSSVLPRPMQKVIFYPVLKKFGGHLDMILLGGAKTDPMLQTVWRKMGVQIVEGYGLTETTAVVTTNTPERSKIGKAGKVIPGVDVKLTPEGEVIVRGATVFKGYYKRPELNVEVFDKEGYFHTGDIGGFDSEGYLELKGRQKFRIVLSNGEKVYPEDIEFKVNQIDGIKEVCVFGYKEDGKEVVGATIILDDGYKGKLDQLVEEANQKLELTQRITHYAEWDSDELPKTATKKLIRREIAEKATELINSGGKSIDATREADAGYEAKMVKTFISLACKVDKDKVKSDMLLVKDLKMDSLRRLSILTLIEEELEVTIDEDNVNDTTTVGKLIELASTGTKRKDEFSYSLIWTKLPFRVLRAIFTNLFKPVHGHFIRMDISGRENLTKLNTPVIFIFNHVGHYDSLAVAYALTARFRSRLFGLSGAQFFKNPIQAFFLRTFANAHPLKKDGSEIKGTLEFVGKMMEEGWCLMMSPEGESQHDGVVKSFKKGIGMIAGVSGVSVIPVKINGYNQIYPRQKSFPYLPDGKGKVDVIIGKPIKFAAYDEYESIADRLQEILSNM